MGSIDHVNMSMREVKNREVQLHMHIMLHSHQSSLVAKNSGKKVHYNQVVFTIECIKCMNRSSILYLGGVY